MVVGGSVPAPAEVSRSPRHAELFGTPRATRHVGRASAPPPHCTQTSTRRGRREDQRKAALSWQGILTHTPQRPDGLESCCCKRLSLAVNHKLELRERRSTLGGKITSAEILGPEKCRVWRGRSILQDLLAGLGSWCQSGELRSCQDWLLWSGPKWFLHL